MGRRKKEPTPLRTDIGDRQYKAKTLEGREAQLAALAYDLVEQRLRDGTATAQETTYLLKIASSKEKREAKIDEAIIKLKEAQIKSLEAAERMEMLYADAINAVNSYRSPNSQMFSPKGVEDK